MWLIPWTINRGGGVDSGLRVKEIRQTLNLTQEEFAHRIGVTVSTVNRWEKLKSKPHKIIMRTIEELAQTD